MTPTIGILGGMGPRATVQFELLLIDRLAGNDQSIPVIVTINDGGIPDRSAFILGRGADPVPRMQQNLQSLERLGASIICIPCNTACTPQIFDRLTPKTAHLINLPNEVADVLQMSGVKKVCVLATSGTIASAVYQQACADAGTVTCVPNALIQKKVTTCIDLIKRNRLVSARQQAVAIAEFMAAEQCDTVILGCTELPLIADALVPANCQSIDTLKVLADACIAYVTQGVPNDARPIYA